ncbi:MAG: hypothetical protein ACR5K7_01615 [Symbiopectobacterium sp.]
MAGNNGLALGDIGRRANPAGVSAEDGGAGIGLATAGIRIALPLPPIFPGKGS